MNPIGINRNAILEKFEFYQEPILPEELILPEGPIPSEGPILPEKSIPSEEPIPSEASKLPEEQILSEESQLHQDPDVYEDTRTLEHLKSLTTSYLSELNVDLKAVLPSKLGVFNNTNFTYKLGNILTNDSLNLTEEKIIHICLFTLCSTDTPGVVYGDINTPPIIVYLLNKDNNNNILYFPHFKADGNIEYEANKYIQEIFKELKKEPVFKGYLEFNRDIYIFYEVDLEYTLDKLNYNNTWWWTSLFEIVNLKMVLNFAIHETVFRVFYEKPLLISLFDDDNNKIPIPSIGYFGEYYKYILFSVELGLPKESSEADYGPFYYLTTYQFAGNYATWNMLKKPELINNELITTDEDGKYQQGGLLRIAFYTGKVKYELDNLLKLNDVSNNYNSLYISSKNNYPVLNPKFVIRNSEQLFPLSYHFIDTKQIDTPFFNLNGYNIE